ncbi:hypothetical protein [Novosphingobium sp. 9]|uniref:hypothetical protein n=1 Tax=Novosphingobium sp. 9 TaxID=2025349 RepID=UPI0021B4E57E|nr:hypothetical protein [Novosphingobium sp. 9]
MPAFYLTFLAVLLAGFGARDQITMASLARVQGQRPGVLLTGMVCAFLTAGLAAWAGLWMLGHLPPPARGIFAAMALAIAGVESLLVVPRKTLLEPTLSLGALALVLVAQQITDAARFVVLAMAVGMAAPLVSGLAGAFAGAALAVLAWSQPDWLYTLSARWVRRGVGATLMLVAALVAIANLGIG